MDSPFLGVKNQEREPYLRMRHGNRVDFLNPKPEQIIVDDIAWHLARQCRFNSALTQWYSNAEHSIMGAKMAGNEQLAREFLIHDAAEYVFGDIPSPVGRLCPEYKKLCNEFQDFIYKLFLGYIPDHDAIKVIDDRICATEMIVLRKSTNVDLCAQAYTNVRFHCWPWHEAYIRYLDLFTWYFPEVKNVKSVLGNAASE